MPVVLWVRLVRWGLFHYAEDTKPSDETFKGLETRLIWHDMAMEWTGSLSHSALTEATAPSPFGCWLRKSMIGG